MVVDYLRGPWPPARPACIKNPKVCRWGIGTHGPTERGPPESYEVHREVGHKTEHNGFEPQLRLGPKSTYKSYYSPPDPGRSRHQAIDSRRKMYARTLAWDLPGGKGAKAKRKSRLEYIQNDQSGHA